MNKSERRALEAQANAILSKAGSSLANFREGSRAIGASALGYGNFIVPSDSSRVWDGEEMIAKAVNMKSNGSINFLDIDAGDPFEGVEESEEECYEEENSGLVLSSRMSLADAIDMVSFYESSEGKAMIASAKAMRAKRSEVLKVVNRKAKREEVRVSAKAERALARRAEWEAKRALS